MRDKMGNNDMRKFATLTGAAVAISLIALVGGQTNAAHCDATITNSSSIQSTVDVAIFGDVVCLDDSGGVFSQSVVFGPEDSGITLTNDHSASPVLDGTGPADAGTVILADGIQLLDDVTDVTIKGLEIRSYTSTARSSAIQAWDVDTTDIQIRNNNMHDLTWNGVLVGSEGGFVHDSWMVSGNHAFDFGFVGIELTNCNSCSILHNTVNAGNGFFGIVVQARSTSTTGAGVFDVDINGVNVGHNAVSDSLFAGIYVFSFIGHPTAMSLSLLKFVGQASLVDEAMPPS